MAENRVLEEMIPMTPVHFFAFGVDCLYSKGQKGSALAKQYLMPDLSSFHEDKPFADVALAWNEKGIYATVFVKKELSDVRFPDFQQGDAVELFFDTRDVKTSGFNTRFCHHFYFLPESIEVDGNIHQAGEITRFRTEDRHELADPSLLFIKCEKEKRGYRLHLMIPADCLHGYDPLQFDRLGFTYRIHRAGGAPQFFSASSEDFSIEQQPSLWASLRIVRE